MCKYQFEQAIAAGKILLVTYVYIYDFFNPLFWLLSVLDPTAPAHVPLQTSFVHFPPDPGLITSYWGRALCDSQLLWGGENITSSIFYLRKAPLRPLPRDDQSVEIDRLNRLYLFAVMGSKSSKQVGCILIYKKPPKRGQIIVVPIEFVGLPSST